MEYKEIAVKAGSACQIIQLKLQSIAIFTYIIVTDQALVLVDPTRDMEPLQAISKRLKKPIKSAFFTHFHADFVAGHSQLLAMGLDIHFGPDAHPGFKCVKLGADDKVALGEGLAMKAIATPGHTPESACFVLIEQGKEIGLFTGDTLFINAVGRPDLAADVKISRQDMSAMLYDSLHKLLAVLPDSTLVFPGHGSGSLCGAGMSGDSTYSSIGSERANNPMLKLAKAEFIKTNTQTMFTPKYFFQAVTSNKQTNKTIGEALQGLKEVTSKDELNDAQVVDVRKNDMILKGFVKGSYAVSLGLIENWGARIYGPKDKLILVVDNQDNLKEAYKKFCRIALDVAIKGYLIYSKASGLGLEEDSIVSIEPAELKGKEAECLFMDVRSPHEVEEEHMANYINYPVDQAIHDAQEGKRDHLDSILKKGVRIYSHCKGGARSTLTISVLKRWGVKDIVNMTGGLAKMVEAGLTTVKK